MLTVTSMNVAVTSILRNDIKEFNNESTEVLIIKVYPNPTSANSVIHIENAIAPATFKLFDNTGKLVVIKDRLNNGDFEIDNSEHASGIYFYQVLTMDNQQVNGKLIIQK